MKTLHQIGVEQNTDKAVQHGYLAFYEFLFAKFRDEPIQILEIGVQFGNSLRVWREYFKRSLICGIDVVHNDVSFDPGEGIALIVGDAYSQDMLTRLGNAQFDLIIEDGDHEPEHQAWSVANYGPMLTPEGILIIEDISSMKTAGSFKKYVPDGFQSVSVDVRREGGLPDSILFLCWRAP